MPLNVDVTYVGEYESDVELLPDLFLPSTPTYKGKVKDRLCQTTIAHDCTAKSSVSNHITTTFCPLPHNFRIDHRPNFKLRPKTTTTIQEQIAASYSSGSHSYAEL